MEKGQVITDQIISNNESETANISNYSIMEYGAVYKLLDRKHYNMNRRNRKEFKN